MGFLASAPSKDRARYSEALCLPDIFFVQPKSQALPDAAANGQALPDAAAALRGGGQARPGVAMFVADGQAVPGVAMIPRDVQAVPGFTFVPVKGKVNSPAVSQANSQAVSPAKSQAVSQAVTQANSQAKSQAVSQANSQANSQAQPIAAAGTPENGHEKEPEAIGQEPAQKKQKGHA